MHDQRTDHLQAKVPRYTSYPTAPHFGTGVTSETYASWLADLDPVRPVSLYLHVPFCAEMCWYCGCFTKIVRRYEPISEYAEVLLAEAGMVSARAPESLPVTHVHWGGGSPTMLKADDWRRLMDGLRLRFAFQDDVETAVELDPRTTTREYVTALKDAGVTRVSIGVQDFDPGVQQAINRVQPFDVTERVVNWLRDAGIRAINLDLMYGLPNQTVPNVIDMVGRAMQLQPSRIALFGYAHVPWMKSHQRLIDEAALPGPTERYQQQSIAADMLKTAGFEAIGFDHFADPADSMALANRAQKLARNFQGYSTDGAETLIGLGASAIGTLPQGYVQNVASITGYRRSIQSGQLAISRGIALGADDRLRRDVINAIMCGKDTDVATLCRQHGASESTLDAELEILSPYVTDGLIERHGRRIVVTEFGRPFLRLIASAFDAYLDRGTARHSVAV